MALLLIIGSILVVIIIILREMVRIQDQLFDLEDKLKK